MQREARAVADSVERLAARTAGELALWQQAQRAHEAQWGSRDGDAGSGDGNGGLGRGKPVSHGHTRGHTHEHRRNQRRGTERKHPGAAQGRRGGQLGEAESTSTPIMAGAEPARRQRRQQREQEHAALRTKKKGRAKHRHVV